MADKALNRDTSTLDSTTWDHRWGFRDTKWSSNRTSASS